MKQFRETNPDKEKEEHRKMLFDDKIMKRKGAIFVNILQRFNAGEEFEDRINIKYPGGPPSKDDNLFTLRELHDIYIPLLSVENRKKFLNAVEFNYKDFKISLEVNLERNNLPKIDVILDYLNKSDFRSERFSENKTVSVFLSNDKQQYTYKVFCVIKRLVESNAFDINKPGSIKKISSKLICDTYNAMFSEYPISANQINREVENLMFKWFKGNGNKKFLNPTDIQGRTFRVNYEYWIERFEEKTIIEYTPPIFLDGEGDFILIKHGNKMTVVAYRAKDNKEDEIIIRTDEKP